MLKEPRTNDQSLWAPQLPSVSGQSLTEKWPQVHS